MPKIRDLAISTIPLMAGGRKEECWFVASKVPAPEPPPGPQCHPSKEQPKGPKKYARGLPNHAVIQLRQQLQHQIDSQPHS